MRLRSVILVGALGLATVGAAPPAAPAETPVEPLLADTNGDGISDALHAELGHARRGDRIAVIATFEDHRAAAAARSTLESSDVTRDLGLVPGFTAALTGNEVRALSRTPGVVRIDPDFEVSTMNDAANADFGTSRAKEELQVDGGGVEVCVVDTGVDPDHEQFSTKQIAFYDAVNGRTQPYDDNGHGTHVAATAVGDGTGGTAAARYAGVAPAADLSAAKVLSSSGSGTASQVIAGVDWCAGRDTVHIISMSLGSAAASDGQDAISQSVNAAAAGGKIVVVAAGNSGDGEGTVGSPGAAEGAITVAAAAEWSSAPGTANHSRGIHLAPWSSRGPTLDGRIKPDVTAPGVTITSARSGTADGYITHSGTSMATPFVAGTVALALDADPGLDPSAARDLVEGTAQERGSEGRDVDWGAGLIDGYAVVATAAGSDGSTTFPVSATLPDQVVEDHGVWSIAFDIAEQDLVVPIAATIIIDGQMTCSWWFAGLCLAYEWSPDLDAQLIDPSGSTIATSTCPLECHSGSIGRQETIQVMPTMAGTYTLEVHPYSDSPNEGQGGRFTVDLSHGPVDAPSTEDPGPEPDPDPEPEGPEASFTAQCEDLTCDFTDSSVSDGEIVSWAWDFGDGATSTQQHPQHSYDASGNYTVKLTVTDTNGSADEVTQPVSVTAPDVAAALASIDYSFAGGKNRHLIVTVTVEDDHGAAVPGASVTVRIEPDSGTVATASGTTGSAGTVSFRWNNAPGRCWTTTVTALEAEGLDWDAEHEGNIHVDCRPS